jgi:nitrite reductase/ring-hydroxylating ferredoxin subunit
MIVDVGRLDEFDDGDVRIVPVDGREIGIVRWADKVFALANLCAHQRGPLCRGRVAPRLQASEPGTLELGPGTPVIACPWHGWEFDVRTGLALWDERYRVRTYAARVVGGRVVVDVGRRGTSR